MAAALVAQPQWAATNPQRRARVMFAFKELLEREMEALGAPAVVRAWQGHRRCQGRHPARPRSDRVRLRHPACAEGRIHARRGPRHRRLFDAPAARRRRGHHAVQLPGDDPDVDVRASPSPCGNAFILKPPERDPSVPVRLAELLMRGRRCPRASCRSSTATRRWSMRSSTIPTSRRSASSARPTSPHYVYSRGTANGKRVQAHGRRQEPRHRHARRRSRPGRQRI